ncbi:MAG: LysR substrate-binding domain-containing protein [Pseudomonadota bacterium]
MKITLRQLEYLVALAEESHFGRAAEKVAISQPALSQQIREIEANLGVALVERGRQVCLTRAGRQVVGKAREIIALTGDLEKGAPRLEGLRGTLRIGIIPTIAPYLLPALLSRMGEDDITVQVHEAVTDQVLKELADAQLDAVICALPIKQPGLTAVPVLTDRFLYATAKSDTLPPPQRPEEVTTDRLLLLDDGHCLADQALQVCGLRRGSASLGAASLTTLARLVGEGHGVTMLPEIAADIEGRDLALHPFHEPQPARTIACVFREQAVGEKWASDLVALLRADDAEHRRAAE